ncbi:hypothetical protein PHSY_007303 [Pseudozyma hubeiensis SY62]|uniref:Uncharacterized protein n=1 Tax=Pseudozyma hubeiensis (strain SY62) TaxID=1305764 RepID=R9PNI3_PSEHS|nr:hypothetical protein PHSY_007303 [Pseudozyma hubeiensis SY62]GAC99700.1 hypothetical protein PHSY_007303 [Pseudozyma hubeiensis SY62]
MNSRCFSSRCTDMSVNADQATFCLDPSCIHITHPVHDAVFRHLSLRHRSSDIRGLALRITLPAASQTNWL